MTYKAYIVAGLFIVADIVTGILKAVKSGELDSKVMREGLFHKLGELLTVVFANLLEYAQGMVELGFDIPLVAGVAAYIAMMETVSVLENLCALNPSMAGLLSPYLAKLNHEPLAPEEGGENHE